jgi:glutamate formiminotransferase
MMDFEEQYITAAIQVAIGASLALIAYFINRAIGRVDNNEKANNDLREEIGCLKNINENQWDDIEELEEDVQKLEHGCRLLSDRLIVLETKFK